MVNLPLMTVISQAYMLPDYAIVGGPAWLRTDRWDIIGKSDVPGCSFSVTPGPAGLSFRGRLLFSNFPILLGQVVGRPLLDRTGLSGRYAVDLTFAPDSAVPRAADAPSLFTAVQDQLGLKLESMTVPTEVLVIDSAARATED